MYICMHMHMHEGIATHTHHDPFPLAFHLHIFICSYFLISSLLINIPHIETFMI